MHSSNHLEPRCNRTNATRLHLSPVYFYTEHNGNCSQTRDSRLFIAQTTVKVNCRLRSQQVYVNAAPSRQQLDTSTKVSTVIGSKDNERLKAKRNAGSKH